MSGYQQWQLDRTSTRCLRTKHADCVGDAWDDELGSVCRCLCGCHPEVEPTAEPIRSLEGLLPIRRGCDVEPLDGRGAE